MRTLKRNCFSRAGEGEEIHFSRSDLRAAAWRLGRRESQERAGDSAIQSQHILPTSLGKASRSCPSLGRLLSLSLSGPWCCSPAGAPHCPSRSPHGMCSLSPKADATLIPAAPFQATGDAPFSLPCAWCMAPGCGASCPGVSH